MCSGDTVPHVSHPPDHAGAATRRAAPARLLIRAMVAGVGLYRVTLGPFLGGHCRFQPTCSQYMIDALHKHGPVRGAWRGLRRIARCHPWGPSGYDPA